MRLALTSRYTRRLAAAVPALAICLAAAATSAAAPPAHPHQGRGAVTLAAVGDTMLGNTPELPSRPAAYLDPVRRQLRGDVVFGNLEGTLTDVSSSPKCPGGNGGDCFAFRAPPRFARVFAGAGFTLMSNANNHSYDFGAAGQEQTVRALHRAGIAQTGLPGEITRLRAGGARIAAVGFAPYATTASLLDLAAARRLIRRAARGADIVVVAIHAGAEGLGAQHLTGGEEHYLGENRGNPERFARMAVRAGADLVLGSGPHVLRAMQVYRGRLIAYSLGNFCGFHDFDTSGALGDSVVLHVTLSRHGAFRSGRLASVRLTGPGRPAPDPSGAGAALVRRLSREDLGAAGVKVSGAGVIRP
ncbi:MAG TPA: CapA family protein [Solirubrobacterales bacterium]|jgi:poly-gamma-glutamate capsule biosynthesis protein CapA/YwtB (metallophosphatase superfamily)